MWRGPLKRSGRRCQGRASPCVRSCWWQNYYDLATTIASAQRRGLGGISVVASSRHKTMQKRARPATDGTRTGTESYEEIQQLQHQQQSHVALGDFREPIHILGAGSIGMLWAASIRFALPNYPVKVLLRRRSDHDKSSTGQPQEDPRFLWISIRDGYRTDANRQPARVVQVPCETIDPTTSAGTSSAPHHGRPIQNLIVATKAASACEAVASVADRLTDSARLIVLCNGALSVAQQLSSQPWAQNHRRHHSRTVHYATTTHGAYRDDDDTVITSHNNHEDGSNSRMRHVVHAGYGNCVLQGCAPLAAVWTMAGLNCRHVESTDDTTMQQLLWNKLAANCVINPLTALHQCRNGQVRELPNFQKEYFSPIVTEVVKVFLAETNSDRDFEEVKAELSAYVDTVISDTAQNKSSMLQDVLAGRETEVDSLSGYIAQLGAKHGIECPVNQKLWRSANFLQR